MLNTQNEAIRKNYSAPTHVSPDSYIFRQKKGCGNFVQMMRAFCDMPSE